MAHSHCQGPRIIEFSLNVLSEFAEFSDKNISHYSKKPQTSYPDTICVRDQHTTTLPARHMWETTIHASVIYQNLWIRWIPALFMENFIGFMY